MLLVVPDGQPAPGGGHDGQDGPDCSRFHFDFSKNSRPFTLFVFCRVTLFLLGFDFSEVEKKLINLN